MWQLVYTTSHSALNGSAIAVPYYFNSSLLIVDAICHGRKPRWHEAGWIKQVKSTPNVGTTKSYMKKIFLEKQEVRFEPSSSLPYTIEFIPRDWIPSITLNFWENDELDESINTSQQLANLRLLGVGL